MSTDRSGNPELQFGRHTLDLGRGVLRDGQRDIKLRPQSFQILKILVEKAGQLVTKRYLHEEVWKGTTVTDDSVTQCILDIRKALGDADKAIIRTIPRRGFMLDLEVHAQPQTAPRPALTRPKLLLLAFATLAVVGLLTARLWIESSDEASISDSPPNNSIAVMPFVDLSDEQDLMYFGESLSEEVILRLSQSPELHVVARTSSFSVSNSDLGASEISRRLNVRYVVEGSVRRVDNTVRTVVQFIDARTDKHIWSRPFNADLEQFIDVQSEIAAAIASELNLKLRTPPFTQRSTDPVTYNLFGQARHIINSRELDRLPEAISLLESALERDPEFIRGMTELSRAYYQQRLTDQKTWDQALQQSLELIDEVLVLAPDDPIANAWMGWREALHNRNYEKGADHYRRAFEGDPLNVDIIRGAILVWQVYGLADDSVLLAEYLMERDPLCVICHEFLVMAYESAERYAEAEEQAQYMLQQQPDRKVVSLMLVHIALITGQYERAMKLLSDFEMGNAHATSYRAMAYFGMGNIAEYKLALQRLHDIADDSEGAVRTWVYFGLSEAYAVGGDRDSAFYYLEKHLGSVNFLGVQLRSKHLDSLRGDPRWQVLLETHHMTDEQFDSLQLPNVSDFLPN